MSQDSVEKLRQACIARGATGILSIGRLFRIKDDDGSRSLEYPEFEKAIREYGLNMPKDEIKAVFSKFDRSGNGKIDYDEFLFSLRPPMNPRRIALINQAFDRMDKNSDGIITPADLKGVYTVKSHPKFVNGEYNEMQVFTEFLNTFEVDHKNGEITRDEFINYYSGISASIDDDAYFDLMMRQAWKL